MRVGIVTPAWNMAPWIGATIRSVLAQTHADWRMVVVDDGSTDATAAVTAGFRDARLALLRQANAGVSVARNRGLAALDPDAEAVLWLDADDCLAPDALARLVAALRAAPAAVAAAGPCAIAGRVLRPPAGDLLEPLLWRNRFANGGHLLIRRAATIAAGPHRPGLAYGEDWEYLIRVALVGPFTLAAGRAPLLQVRLRPDGACHRLGTDPARVSGLPANDLRQSGAARPAGSGAPGHAAPARRGREPVDHRPRTDPRRHPARRARLVAPFGPRPAERPPPAAARRRARAAAAARAVARPLRSLSARRRRRGDRLAAGFLTGRASRRRRPCDPTAAQDSGQSGSFRRAAKARCAASSVALGTIGRAVRGPAWV